jgi:hypothetical protein
MREEVLHRVGRDADLHRGIKQCSTIRPQTPSCTGWSSTFPLAGRSLALSARAISLRRFSCSWPKPEPKNSCGPGLGRQGRSERWKRVSIAPARRAWLGRARPSRGRTPRYDRIHTIAAPQQRAMCLGAPTMPIRAERRRRAAGLVWGAANSPGPPPPYVAHGQGGYCLSASEVSAPPYGRRKPGEITQDQRR